MISSRVFPAVRLTAVPPVVCDAERPRAPLSPTERSPAVTETSLLHLRLAEESGLSQLVRSH